MDHFLRELRECKLLSSKAIPPNIDARGLQMHKVGWETGSNNCPSVAKAQPTGLREGGGWDPPVLVHGADPRPLSREQPFV